MKQNHVVFKLKIIPVCVVNISHLKLAGKGAAVAQG